MLSGPIVRVALPVALVPEGSATEYVNLEEVPNSPFVGRKSSEVSCVTVNISPTYTLLTPSDKNTVPSVGSPVTVTFSLLVGYCESEGALMPIGLNPLFSLTVKRSGVVFSAMGFFAIKTAPATMSSRYGRSTD
jgi:hypothetical protein